MRNRARAAARTGFLLIRPRSTASSSLFSPRQGRRDASRGVRIRVQAGPKLRPAAAAMLRWCTASSGAPMRSKTWASNQSTPRSSRCRASTSGVVRASVSTQRGAFLPAAALSGPRSSRPCRERQMTLCQGRARRAQACCKELTAGSSRTASSPSSRTKVAPMPNNSGSPSASTSTRSPMARS